MSPKMKSVLKRVATGAVVMPAVFLMIWWPAAGPVLTLFISLLAAVGLYEYYAIVRARRISPETIGGIIGGALVALSGAGGYAGLTNLTLFGAVLLVSSLHIVRGMHSVAGLASSAFGVFYVGWFSAHVLLLHQAPVAGHFLVTILLLTVFLTDTMAYVIGSLFGRHKMAPKVSPNKSWEGAIGGLVSACLGMAALFFFGNGLGCSGFLDWSLLDYVFTGAILSIVAQIGDLTESCLKRDAGVKDSGFFFPGHGGVLDRCDGFLFAAPFLYYIYAPLALTT